MKKLLLAFILFPFCVHAQIITTIAGDSTQGYSGDGGVATAAELYYPDGVAVDDSGNVYIAEDGNNVIRKVSHSGIISTIAGNGTAGYSGDGGPATAAQLLNPVSVTLDAAGNIFISDWGNMVIRKVNTLGIISTFAGNGTAGYTGDGGAATAATLYTPEGVAADGSGNVYIVDELNSVVRKVNMGGIISTIAGNGTQGYSGDGSPATAATLYWPEGIAADGNGNIYIADTYNQRIRKVNASGIITTITGSGTAGYSGDGEPATAAEIYYPGAVAVDDSGSVYIADVYNYRIRKVNTSGIISTIAGNGTAGYSGDGGAATDTATELNWPAGVAVDDSGNVYIADEDNNRVRMVSGIVLGAAAMCMGATDTLCDVIHGGSWMSSNMAIATIGTGSGIVTAVAPGTITISYIASGIPILFTLTVNPLPNAGSITGQSSVCVDSSVILTTESLYGTWSSSNTSIAKVDSAGIVTGITPGNVMITYSVTNSCGTATTIYADTVDGCTTGVMNSVNSGAASITIFPNPATTAINIQSTDNISEVVITDLLGQTMHREQPDANCKLLTVNCSDFPGGMYLIKINGVVVRKFLKK